ncbi:MAG: Ppx/GppA family phosphatase [Akkermansiaceae bacterium]|nr:Ppx/GppA family phosphatase [Verrucomicrobiales bacterium]
MLPARRAVIDVGTNSVKLLVADVSAQEVQPVWEDSKQTRLGTGFYETHILQPEPILKTARAVAKFTGVARDHGAVSIRIIATSAARDAVNAAELVSALESAVGIKVEIISGDQEAEWAFRGVTTDPKLATAPLLLLDVGGGSTEFILGQGRQKHFQESFPLGTVRLLEKIPHSDPPQSGELKASREWIGEFLAREVQPKLTPALQRAAKVNDVDNQVQLIGTGGTTSILGRMEAGLDVYDRDRIEATRMSLQRLDWHVVRLWSLPLAERLKIIGLPPKRADVILTGVLIYQMVMERFGFSELRVSTRGLRFAAVMDASVR